MTLVRENLERTSAEIQKRSQPNKSQIVEKPKEDSQNVVNRNLYLKDSGSCFLTFWQLFFAGFAIMFCLLSSCFLLPNANSRSNFNSPTAQLFGSCVLLFQQFFFNFSAVVFWYFGSWVLLVWQLFFIVQQLLFAGSAFVFWFFGSCVYWFGSYYFPLLLFFAGWAVVLCCPTHTVD